jgi:hypothetical protein
MRALWYTEPSGEWAFEPSAGWVLASLRRGDDDYWGPYSPVGVLEWHEHPDREMLARRSGTATARQQLLFVRHRERGWYFEFSTSNQPDRRWLVPLAPRADRDTYVKHWAHGEQLYFLAGSFVPQEVAERVVADILATGEPSTLVEWVPFDEVRPRLDSGEYRERPRQARGKAERVAAADRPRD